MKRGKVLYIRVRWRCLHLSGLRCLHLYWVSCAAAPPARRRRCLGRPVGRPAVSVRWLPASGVSALYCLVPVNTSQS